jgi:hypothetical protein
MALVYLVAVMDWYSRKVLSRRDQAPMEASFKWIVWKRHYATTQFLRDISTAIKVAPAHFTWCVQT